MHPTYAPCPRPCLKRSTHQPTPVHDKDELLSIDPSILSSLVRFPPSPVLTKTYTAYSPSAYDRTPIVVSPNTCSMPERGCPGRTYEPSPSKSSSSPSSRSSKHQVSFSRPGNHAYPRSNNYRFDEDDDDLTPRPTPTVYSKPLPPPALVPDVSSSSSESDESDGWYSSHHSNDPYSLNEFASLRISPAKQSSFLPHPHPHPPMLLSPTSSHHRTSTSPTRSRPPSSSSAASSSPTSSRRTRSPSRPRRVRGQPSNVVGRGDVDTNYKTFSERSLLESCKLDLGDEGCFGGF